MDYYKLKVLNNKKKIIFVVSLLTVFILICYYFFIYQNDDTSILNNNESISQNSVDEDDLTFENIYVDIKGYVVHPGVYSFKISENARVNDLITKAGGLTKDADTSTINLSKKLEDEMTIIIYSKNEITNYLKAQDDLKKKLEICESKLKNNACIKIQEKDVVNEKKDQKININEASLDELLTLSGIGEAKAKAIIEYREKNKFTNIEEIKNVEGIGENLFISIRENITV